MTLRAALVLGFFVVVAALVHGGFYAAGHDFVVNRFTGHFQFVPAEEESETLAPVMARGDAASHAPRGSRERRPAHHRVAAAP